MLNPAFHALPCPSAILPRTYRSLPVCTQTSPGESRTSTPPQKAPRAIVIGAGIAGLTAALKLSDSFAVTLLEASDAVGGRVRTDQYKGYTLDRGFQVFLEGYPSAKEQLDYEELDLRPFWPGAMIRFAGAFYTIADPFRSPLLAMNGLFAPVGNFVDKFRVALLRGKLLAKSVNSILNEGTKSLPLDVYLQKEGFSKIFVSAFFRPFYQGIFLAPLRNQSSKMFEFVFRTFAAAPASLPRTGIGAVTEQLGALLPPDVQVRLNTTVTEVGKGFVKIGNEELKCDVLVVATEGPEAIRLLGNRIDAGNSRGSICLYFSKEGPSPVGRPMLVLSGEEGDGPVNNMFVVSDVVPTAAPKDCVLISTTIVGDDLGRSDDNLEQEVREQMSRWFGIDEVREWELLKIYRIPHSQTAQDPDFSFEKGTDLGDGVFVCGDHRNSPTLHGAIVSGKQAAEEARLYISRKDN
eukprot:GFKZ01009252.1.p1 GENE.GFKZ01009252.1~~GFKZ01009252.1.p1  ORF type:complete len:464 (+),score=53.84 GFKZ01009252.1:112-1503(+)